MALPIYSSASASASFFHTTSSPSPPSLSCSTKVFVGLKPQDSSLFASAIPNLTAGFFDRVSKRLHSRYGSKPTRGRVYMMPMGTPMIPYQVPGQKAWQMVDLWNVLYRERVIYVGNYINEHIGNLLLATMLYLDTIDDDRRLFMYINGTGGDLTPSMAIYDTMQSLRTPLGTHCLGFAYNLSGFLLAAGDKGYRSTMPLSRISMQAPAGAARGQADDIRNESDELIRIRDYIYQELAKNTGQTLEKIAKDLNGRIRLDAEEAVEYGIVDRIVRPARIKGIAS